MSQASYGTITISDLTDITDVYLEYCMVEAGKTASEVESKSSWISPEVAWSTIYPTWRSGYEIWIRQVQIKEGIDEPITGSPYLDTAVNDINITIDDINIILEEFKYQTGTDIAPVFGAYEQKTISSVVEGQLDRNSNNVNIWRDYQDVQIASNSNTLYHNSRTKQYYLYENNDFVEILYDEGYLDLAENNFYNITKIDNVVNRTISKINKYYKAIFYYNVNEEGNSIQPKYYIVNDSDWLEQYPEQYDITTPYYWIKRTRIYRNNIIQTDIYKDQPTINLYQLQQLSNSLNKWVQNSNGTFVIQGLENYDSTNESTYGYNVHTNANGIYLRYNNYKYVSINSLGFELDYQINDSSSPNIPSEQGPPAMILNNNGISFYQLYLEENTNNYASTIGFELKNNSLNFYSPPNNEGKNNLRMSLDNDDLIFYSKDGKEKIAIFGENSYLKGTINANGGDIGGIHITENSLYTQEHNALNSNKFGLFISNNGDMSGGPQSNNSGWALNADGTGHFGDATIIENNGKYIFKLHGLVLEEKLTPDDIQLNENDTLSTTINFLDDLQGNITAIKNQLGDYTSHIQVKTDTTDGMHNYILITAGEITNDGSEEIKSGLKLHDQYIAFQISDGEGGTVQAARMTNDTLIIDKINLGYTLDFGRYILEERIGGVEGTHFSILIE